MAGADYGYVGAGNGKYNIPGTEAVVKNVAQKAVDVLLRVIERVEPFSCNPVLRLWYSD